MLLLLLLWLLLLFFAHQHKAAGVKIEAKQMRWLQWRFHSVTIVLWKETAFPLWRAMDRRWKRNVVYVVSSVMVVMPVSCVSSMAVSCHVRSDIWPIK